MWLEDGEQLPPLEQDRPAFNLRDELRFKLPQAESWIVDAVVEDIIREEAKPETKYHYAVAYNLGRGARSGK